MRDATLVEASMTRESYDGDFRMEVRRMSYELSVAHGRSALSYATKQAERALVEAEPDEHAFWSAVAASLTPR